MSFDDKKSRLKERILKNKIEEFLKIDSMWSISSTFQEQIFLTKVNCASFL